MQILTAIPLRHNQMYVLSLQNARLMLRSPDPMCPKPIVQRILYLHLFREGDVVIYIQRRRQDLAREVAQIDMDTTHNNPTYTPCDKKN